MSRVNYSTLKALDVLEILAEADDGLRLTDVAEETGYPLSTARRLLVSLIDRAYVEQDARTNRYYLGAKILTLQALGIRNRHVGRRAYPLLIRLRQQLDETINLGVLSDRSVVYLETLAPDASFAFYAPPGTRMPLHCTAMGKLFLAHLPPPAQAGFMDGLDLKPFTAHTITALPALRTHLAEIARQGYAVDDEEYALGVRCLAAPIRDSHNHVVAGVSVTALATRMAPERVDSVAISLTRTCQEISQTLGFQRDGRDHASGDREAVPAT